MPYAITGRLSKNPIEGGIEISQEQYKDALQAMMQGKRVAVRDGELYLLSQEKRRVYSTEDGSALDIYQDDDTPEGYTEEKKPSAHHHWENGQWVEDTEAKVADWRKEAHVSMRQARLKLLQEEKLDLVEDEIVKKGKAAEIEWEYAQQVDRLSPLVSAMQSILELSDSELDTWFEEAQEL